MQARLDELQQRLQEQTENHLGYPYNLEPTPPELLPFLGFSLNNLGDSFSPSRYGINTHAMEREVIQWFVALWKGGEDTWGTVTACGTEGNLLGILYGREAMGQHAVLITSVEAHYSVAKAARMYRMPFIELASRDGEIDYEELRNIAKAQRQKGSSIVLVLNAGSTVLGGHDRLAAAMQALNDAGVPPAQRYVHVDAALSGLITPLMTDEETGEFAFGFHRGADSIAVSGHKQLGIATPCGVLCCKKEHMERWAAGTPESASYVTRRDTTLSGSRNGFASLALWHAVTTRDKDTLAQQARQCIQRARNFADALRAAVPLSEARVYCPLSTTVVFRMPSAPLADKYQLACTAEVAHIVITPSVKSSTLWAFWADYFQEFSVPDAGVH